MIESSDSANDATVNPVAYSLAIPAGQLSIRVHGTWNTVPRLPRTLRRYSGPSSAGQGPRKGGR